MLGVWAGALSCHPAVPSLTPVFRLLASEKVFYHERCRGVEELQTSEEGASAPAHARSPLTSFSSSHLSFSDSYTSLGRRFAVGRRDVASGPAQSDV